MAQASTLIALHSSRLIRLLSELAVSDVEPSTRRFGDRFGQLFALSDSISLSQMHSELASTEFESRHADINALSEEGLAIQKKLVESISQRFIAEPGKATARNRFPALREAANAEQLTTYSSYLAFYANLQREMDREIQHLLSVIRDGASGLSPELAKLVVIDTELGATLANHSRKLLGQIPRLLERRFDYLRQHHHQSLFDDQADDCQTWGKPGGWLDTFRLDMHQTALAELDLRLQPAIGLLEAIQAHAPEQDTANQPSSSQLSSSQKRQQQL